MISAAATAAAAAASGGGGAVAASFIRVIIDMHTITQLLLTVNWRASSEQSRQILCGGGRDRGH
jgi:hypothetical protein